MPCTVFSDATYGDVQRGDLIFWRPLGWTTVRYLRHRTDGNKVQLTFGLWHWPIKLTSEDLPATTLVEQSGWLWRPLPTLPNHMPHRTD
ncbi:hypothetical protein GCM10010174_26130 [Kutzneria viridogrisea]|uniref:hypothetical protein n=1 Tax=Kutzneria viridogrisea TaxID=47990 RepID=UPI0031FA2C67